MKCPNCHSTEIKVYRTKPLFENKEKLRRYYICLSCGHHFNADGIDKDDWCFQIINKKDSESLQKKKDWFENFDEFVKEKLEKGYTYHEIFEEISYVK